MVLKTDFKADIFEGNRKYEITTDTAGRSEIMDVTEYVQEGDILTPEHINATNAEINKLETVQTVLLPAAGWSASAPYTQTVSTPGITTADNPVMSLHIPNGATPAQVKAWNKAFGMVDEGISGDGQSTFKCYNKKPAVDFTVAIKGV